MLGSYFNVIPISMAWLALIWNVPDSNKDVYDNGKHDGDGPVELDALLGMVLRVV